MLSKVRMTLQQRPQLPDQCSQLPLGYPVTQHHRARCHSISDEMGHHQYTLTPNARCSRGVQPLHQSDLTMTSEITTTPQSAILLTSLRAQTAAATRTGALITAAT